MSKVFISEIAKKLKSYGYTVYIAERGTYGFYTDGKHVVSFSESFGGVNFTGCYVSSHSGTGWQLDGGRLLGGIDAETAEIFITAYPPHWATSGDRVTLESPAQHLARYNKTSRYTEVLQCDAEKIEE